MELSILSLICYLALPAGMLIARFTKEEKKQVTLWITYGYYIISGAIFVLLMLSALSWSAFLLAVFFFTLFLTTDHIKPVSEAVFLVLAPWTGIMASLILIENIFIGSIYKWHRKKSLYWLLVFILLPLLAVVFDYTLPV